MPGAYRTEAPAFADTPLQMSGPVWIKVMEWRAGVEPALIRICNPAPCLSATATIGMMAAIIGLATL